MISKKLLQQNFEAFGFHYSDIIGYRLDQYAEMLVEWNQKINLTAITEPDDIVIKHFIDSILLLKAVELPLHARLIDVGTGAGFPSLPVCVVRDDLQPTLLDSLNKRIVFLKELCNKISIQ